MGEQISFRGPLRTVKKCNFSARGVYLPSPPLLRPRVVHAEDVFHEVLGVLVSKHEI